MIGLGDGVMGGMGIIERRELRSRPSLEAPISSCHLRTNYRGTGNLHLDLTLMSGIPGSDPVMAAGVRKRVT